MKLALVSWFFFLAGVGGAATTGFYLQHGRFFIQGELLGLAIWFGLRRYSRESRVGALFLCWVWMVLLSVFVLTHLLPGQEHILGLPAMQVPMIGPVVIQFLGGELPFSTPPILLVLGLLGVVYWHYRVLTRPEIRALFEPKRVMLPPSESP